jgi:hypothetical protein
MELSESEGLYVEKRSTILQCSDKSWRSQGLAMSHVQFVKKFLSFRVILLIVVRAICSLGA